MDTRFTFNDAQLLNEKIYSIQNDLHYSSPVDMVIKMNRYAGRLLKKIRWKEVVGITENVALLFSWSLALGNKLHIDLRQEIWKRFPGICPYCTLAPCECKIRVTSRPSLCINAGNCPSSINEYQDMFAKIYPDNTLDSSGMHLMEEVTELAEELHYFGAKNDTDLLGEVILELVDVFANTLAVANTAGFRLSHVYQVLYNDGCYSCHMVPCGCGLIRTANSTPINT